MIESWGRIAKAKPFMTVALNDRHADELPRNGRSLLAVGAGRSYGDVCYNDGGNLIRCTGLDRFIAFDPVQGRLRAEAGITLSDILRLTLPAGWMLEVMPGTRFVTLGGAVANDVHGKNHHSAGTFGNHVTALEVLRSDGAGVVCSEDSHRELFAATIGGMGLTGLIRWVELRLRRIDSPATVYVRREQFRDLDEYWELDALRRSSAEFTVAWMDGLHGERGVYFSGNLARSAQGQSERLHPPCLAIPCSPPFSLVNRVTTRVFNALYLGASRESEYTSPLSKYFFPLDGVRGWNQLYGAAGFYQYQCVLPPGTMKEAARSIFQLIRHSGQGSFLNVLKTFGARKSPGLMSFPRPGATIAMDFPNRGGKTHRLFESIDAIVREAGGALYPAKDMRMSPAMFESGYPALEEFKRHVDPGFSSSFWRRVVA